MAFDPAIDPEKFVVRQTKATAEVLGPADMSEGACLGREVWCHCMSWNHLERAETICRLLNENAWIPD